MTNYTKSRFISFAIWSLLLAFSWPNSSYSGSAALGPCETVWSGYVDQVEDNLLPFWRVTKIIFVDRDLNAFDCLEQDVNPEFLEYLSGAMPPELRIAEETVLQTDGRNWPGFLCLILTFSDPPYQFVAIILPTDPDLSRHGLCQVRLDVSMNFQLERE